MDSTTERAASVAFGRFRVVPHRRELLADGRPIRLGGRAFDVLIALIEARGAVVGKDALMARVWPDQVIADNSLQSQISALRNALGSDRGLIRTVSGRGYQFTGDIRVLAASLDEPAGTEAATAEPDSELPPTNLPEPVSELIGRDDELREILSLAAAHRLVTLTGAGGIGKTRLALVAARRLLPEFPDGAWLAEFSPLCDPDLVSVTVAAAGGVDLGGSEVSAQRVAQALTDRRLLLVLDTCEHVIAATAALAEAVLRAGSAVRIIATSREPLRVEGEQVYPVPPLAVPAAEADEPWQYGAVRLFVERARAAEPHFAADRRLMATIASICRRLDGIPLAIELAAARAAALGVEELSARLDDRFRLLTGGRRTALPRHQTLLATLDWSYELLTEPERVTLRRLAIFAGSFSLEAAGAVVESAEIAPSDAVDGVSSLVAKSLVAAEIDGVIARYGLLDTTRAYALEKLGESGELEAVGRRHAGHYRDLFERAETEWEARPAAEWLADYGRQIDNLRAALDFAFSPGGDASIGVALTAAGIPLWMHLSLMQECGGRVERALATLEAGANPDLRREMKLYAALGTSLMLTRGASFPETGTAWTRAFKIAEDLNETEYQLRALWGLWSFHIVDGPHHVALRLAQRFYNLAVAPNDQLVGDRLTGASLYYLGDLPGARRHIECVLADSVTPGHRSHTILFQLDPRVTARVFFARILWLQGFADQAAHAAEISIGDVRAAGHAISLCYTLALAPCLIALLAGDLAAAEHYIGMLLDHSARHALPLWHAWGRGYQAVLVIQRGDLITGLSLLRTWVDEIGHTPFAFPHKIFVGSLAAALGDAGQIAEGLAAIEEALSWTERTEERWIISELLRVKGELLLLQGAPAAAVTAEDHFRQALDWAQRQGALSWELRVATSLARLLSDQGRPTDAMALLQPVYDQFTEGFDTADLKAAKALLDALAEAAGSAKKVVNFPRASSRA